MKNNIFSRGLFSLLVLIGLTPSIYSQTNTNNTSKPNIVLILIDDSGLMDLGVFGGEARTPNIDRLAGNGMMFTNMHASPVCAPSRAMLLTGTNSHLAGVANLPEFLPAEYQGKPGYAGVLNDKVQTIATRLKELDYNTYATGKWHLGHDEKTLPNKRGFDRSFILGSSGGNNYEAKGYLPMKPVAHWYADGKETELPKDFYSSKSYIDKTISYHEQDKNKNQPFFSYIAFQAIHAPIQAPKEFVNHYLDTYKQGWEKIRERRFNKAKEMGIIPENSKLEEPFTPLKKWEELSKKEQDDYAMGLAVTAGMLEAMDYHIGRYVEYLKKEGLFENTVFIVTSDNGPDGAEYVSNLYLMNAVGLPYHRDYQNKAEKDYFGSLEPGFATAVAAPFDYFKYYTGEGGLRVPLIISGPNLPKKTRSDVFCFFTDIAPTIYDLLGLSTSANEGFAPITGKSMLPHIKDTKVPVYARGEGIGLEAANSATYFLDGYKIVKNNIPLGDMEWHLYNLVNDPMERNDLIKSNPEQFQKMLAAYQKFAKEVGVIEMPKGYSASGEVLKKSMWVLFWKFSPYFLALLLVIIGLIVGIWRWRRKKRAQAK